MSGEGNQLLGNAVANNDGDGISVLDGVGNSILDTSTIANGGLGIDLAPDGVNANDPGDGDGGANRGQNYPVLTGTTAGNVLGTLDSTASRAFTIQVFANPGCDPSASAKPRSCSAPPPRRPTRAATRRFPCRPGRSRPG